MAKKRTAAQIRATKKLVAMNKARARGKSNPSRSKKKAKKKAAGQMKRAGSALAKWVRSGMPSYSNRPKNKTAQCNPRHKRQKTITVQQAVKLAKAARAGRAVGIKTNPSGKCSVVTGKAARALGKKA